MAIAQKSAIALFKKLDSEPILELQNHGLLLVSYLWLLMAVLMPLIPASICRKAVSQHEGNSVITHVYDLRFIGLVKPFHGAYLLKSCSEQEARSFG